jgi:transformation/transcription domain-associated protein
MMHRPALGNNLHVVFAKMMFGLTDVIVAKETSQGAAKLLEALFETCIEKLESLCVVYNDLRGEHTKEKVELGDSGSDALLIEKARPACAAVYASERPEEVFHGSWCISHIKYGLTY